MNPEFGVLRRGLGINIDLNYKFNYPKSGGGGGGREAGCSLVTRGGRSHSGSTVASGSSSYRWETVKTGQLLKTLPRLAVTKGIAVKSTGSNPHPQSSPIHVREIARPTSLSLSLHGETLILIMALAAFLVQTCLTIFFFFSAIRVFDRLFHSNDPDSSQISSDCPSSRE